MTTSSELDLVFCCDCTGSMGSYIKSAQDNIRAISMQIHQRTAGKTLVRYSLIKYRDHPPQDSTFVTEVFPFTDNIELMKQNIDTMAASGGGDGPEAVSAALHEVNVLDWRPNATKICVLISDAPPHGLGEDGDGFPNGCPQGNDPIKICKEMAAKGITVYAVGVEPTLSSSYKFARDFMMMVAKITEGQFLPLGKAEILGNVIVSGAIEGMDLKNIWEKLESEVAADAAKKGEKLDEAALVSKVQDQLKERRAEFKTEQIAVSNPYMEGYNMKNCCDMEEATSLADARKKLNPALNAHVAQASAAYAWGAQECVQASAPMSSAQCDRVFAKAAKMKSAK